MSNGLRIGISYFLKAGGRSSIWNNGATQNCVFLQRCLERSPDVARVHAINAGDADAPDPGLMLTGLPLDFKRFDDVKDDLDVVIEAHGQLSAAQVSYVRERGGKAIAYRFGNSMILETERVIHGKTPGAIINGAQFDAVWTNAQHVHTCASYWDTLYRAPVRVLPHIWEPLFVDRACRELRDGVRFGFLHATRPWRVAILEPNINIVKTCIVPILACERTHRVRPNVIDSVYVCCADGLKEHLTMRHLVGSLDLQRDKKISFEARYNTPWFVAKFADAVVSHQWECALNYAYYDVIYGGYPLVHNSDLLPSGIGYRYDGFDAADGSRALQRALDATPDEHASRQAREYAFLQTVDSCAPVNVRAHTEELRRLVAQRRAA